MCGILGINKRLAADELERGLSSIAHRGPDDQGIYVDDLVSLGHRRLAILDISPAGHQPMSIADEKVWIVYNGEVYNHLELRNEFGAGYNYRGHSDTETILRGYMLYGKRIVEKLNGIFAFAIYDRRNRELFIARDQLGIKPLYYYSSENTFAFGSEIKAILELGIGDRTLNPNAFQNYLNFLWSPGETTPLKNVKKLLPGYHLTVSLDRAEPPKLEKYYEIPFTGHYSQASERELVDELDERLQVAVKRQLLSDVPVGFFLSGGLDSSLLVAMARPMLSGKAKCFTIDTHAAGVDGDVEDLGYAIKVAKHLDVDLHRIPARADFVNDLDRVIWHLDEPQADPACSLVWDIAKAARENGIVVLLGGAGGDDLFSGYRRHQMLRMEWLFGLLSGPHGKCLKGLVNSLHLPGTLGRRLKKVSQGWGLSKLERLTSYYRWSDPITARSLFQPGFLTDSEFDPASLLRDSLQAIDCESHDLNHLLYWDLKYFLTDHNLNYTDKMSMASGVETRVPYLDLELVEFSCRLPVEMKMRGWMTKYLLRKVAERYLPNEIIYRAKTGFGAPLRSWLHSGKLNHKIQELLHAGEPTNQILALDRVADFVQNTIAGKVDGSYTILTLLAIHSWLKQFFNIASAAKS